MNDNNNKEVKLEEWHSKEDFTARQKSSFGNKLANLIIKISGGLIKNEKQAYYVILVLVAIMFIISFVIFFNAVSSPAPSATEMIPAEY